MRMTLLAHGFAYEFVPNALGLAGIVCVVVVGGGIVYFVVRDTFRFGRKRLPIVWAIAIIALFTAAAFWAAGYVGLFACPVLGVVYALGWRQSREDAAGKEGRDHRPSA